MLSEEMLQKINGYRERKNKKLLIENPRDIEGRAYEIE